MLDILITIFGVTVLGAAFVIAALLVYDMWRAMTAR